MLKQIRPIELGISGVVLAYLFLFNPQFHDVWLMGCCRLADGRREFVVLLILVSTWLGEMRQLTQQQQ
jgi:hypothetical protein